MGNAEVLPFPSGAFAGVTSMGVLHHIPDPARAIAEIRRVLRPGGRFIGMFYHRNSIIYRAKMPLQSVVMRKSLAQLVNEVDGAENPRGRVYSRTELRRLLAGFESLELFAGVLGSGARLRWLERILPSGTLAGIARRWGWFLYVKAVKA